GCARPREPAQLTVHAQADPRATGRRIHNDDWLTPLLGEVRSAGCPEAVGSAWWTRCRPQISAAADAAPRREARSALLRPARRRSLTGGRADCDHVEDQRRGSR